MKTFTVLIFLKIISSFGYIGTSSHEIYDENIARRVLIDQKEISLRIEGDKFIIITLNEQYWDIIAVESYLDGITYRLKQGRKNGRVTITENFLQFNLNMFGEKHIFTVELKTSDLKAMLQ